MHKIYTSLGRHAHALRRQTEIDRKECSLLVGCTPSDWLTSSNLTPLFIMGSDTEGKECQMDDRNFYRFPECVRKRHRTRESERDSTQWAAESFSVYKQLLHTTDVFPICCILKLEMCMHMCMCVCVCVC
ncbi:hypothetical protein XENORESO_013956, partial [Xenotaenia resolanae]